MSFNNYMNNITVIGIGKLGLGFALLLEHIGYNVVGVDISTEYVNKINNKNILLKNHITHLC